MSKSEKTLLIIYYVVLGYKLLGFPLSSLLFVSYSSIFVCYHFFFSFFLFQGVSPSQLFKNQFDFNKIQPLFAVPQVIGTSAIAVGYIGAMFSIQNWPLGYTFLLISITAGVLSLVVNVLFKSKNPVLSKSSIRRLVIYMFPIFVLYITPKQTLLPLTMRNNPELRDALIDMYNHPGDTLYVHKVDSIRESRFPNEPKH